jgi:hypothetical protein
MPPSHNGIAFGTALKLASNGFATSRKRAGRLPVAQANLGITVTPFPWTRIEQETCSGYKIAKQVTDRFTAVSTDLRITQWGGRHN